MGVIIKDIQRNSREIIRIEVSEFKGKELINLRIWYSAMDNNTGDVIYKPTQKGVALNISEFEELKDGIDKLASYISDRQADIVPEQPTESPESITDEDDDKKDEEKSGDVDSLDATEEDAEDEIEK
ncbi:MAG: hypothetical protein GY754_17475 [bacterium]|nr:hypothetical protein [bacterium]